MALGFVLPRHNPRAVRCGSREGRDTVASFKTILKRPCAAHNLLDARDPSPLSLGHGWHELSHAAADARVRRVGDTPPRAGHIVPRLYFSRARCVLQLSSFRARPARASSCEHQIGCSRTPRGRYTAASRTHRSSPLFFPRSLRTTIIFFPSATRTGIILRASDRMLAYAAWEIHRREPDTSFLASIFPALVAYYNYLLSERDPHGHHLASIISPDESGEDNSPRFDIPLGVPHAVSLKDHLAKRTELVDRNRECDFDAGRCMRDFFWVKDVLFNSVLAENLRVLAKIAAYLKRDEYESSFKRDADEVAGAMRERMFEGGVYWSTMGADFTKLKVATWAHFIPLFAGLYTKEEAEYIVSKHLKDPDTFAAPFGIRTTSIREMSYRPEAEDFSWRGPVWIGAHWFICRWLMRYGFTEEAEDIRKKSIALLERSGFRECFNPETGAGMGAHNFTWGALVLDMIEK